MSQAGSDKGRSGIIIVLICAVAFFVRFAVLLRTENVSGVALQKIRIAENLLHHPSARLELQEMHGPLPVYIYAVALSIWDDPFFTPRVTALIFGVLSLLSFYWYARIQFSRPVAQLAALLLSVYPTHVSSSVFSTGEVFYVFFIFLSFYLFLTYEEGKRTALLFYSALSLGCAMFCRFEGSLIILPMTLLLIKEPFRAKATFLLVAVAFLFALFVILCLNCGDCFEFLKWGKMSVTNFFNRQRMQGVSYTTWTKLIGWPVLLWGTLSPAVTLCGFFGLGYSLLRKEHRLSSLSFLFLFAVLTYKTQREELIFDVRYSLIFGLFLIGFAAFLIIAALRYLPRFMRPLATIACVLLLFLPMLQGNRQWMDGYTFPPFAKEVAALLAPRLVPSDTVLIDSPRDDDVMEAAAFHIEHASNAIVARCPRTVRDAVPVADEDCIRPMMRAKQGRPRFLVYAPNGYFPAMFHFSSPGKREEWDGVVANYLFESGPYQVYELIYSDWTSTRRL